MYFGYQSLTRINESRKISGEMESSTAIQTTTKSSMEPLDAESLTIIIACGFLVVLAMVVMVTVLIQYHKISTVVSGLRKPNEEERRTMRAKSTFCKCTVFNNPNYNVIENEANAPVEVACLKPSSNERCTVHHLQVTSSGHKKTTERLSDIFSTRASPRRFDELPTSPRPPLPLPRGREAPKCLAVQEKIAREPINCSDAYENINDWSLRAHLRNDAERSNAPRHGKPKKKPILLPGVQRLPASFSRSKQLYENYHR